MSTDNLHTGSWPTDGRESHPIISIVVAIPGQQAFIGEVAVARKDFGKHLSHDLVAASGRNLLDSLLLESSFAVNSVDGVNSPPTDTKE